MRMRQITEDLLAGAGNCSVIRGDLNGKEMATHANGHHIVKQQYSNKKLKINEWLCCHQYQ